MESTEIDIENEVFKFISKFYSNTSVTEKLAQETIQEFQKLMSGISVTTLKKLKERIPIEYHDFMENCFNLDVFENFDSKWRCMQQFKNSEFYFAPRQFKIGEIGDDKNINNSIKWTKKACYGQIISLRAVLKNFLELPNVFKTIMNFMQTESARIESQGDIHSSLFQGTLWKNISGAFQEKIVIPLYLYYDDFEINNPLSTSAGIYKVGGLYCSIAALPPQFASTTTNVFLAQLIHNSDYKEFGAERCFAEIKDELNYLTQFGITISINGESHHIYFVLIGVLGDNLAVNSLFGFNESFISEYYCRFCKMPKVEAQKVVQENETLLRDKTNYESDLSNRSHGVKNKCVFNEINFFHNTCNWTIDLMHDLYLGICRYDMGKIIKHCILNKYFTLNQLNNRRKFFDHCDADSGNKISTISDTHIQNEHLILTAAEMSCLIAYFGIIVGDLVPPDDPAWLLYTYLFDIISVVTSTIISDNEIIYLRELIRLHHQLYLQTFQGHLTAKFHLLVHYPTIIKIFGPPKFYSCSRFEAFHKISKRYAYVVNCRINILFTLTKKLQLDLYEKFIKAEGFKHVVKFGQVVKYTNLEKLSINLKSFLAFESIKINNKIYKPSYAFHVCNDSENNPVFGSITAIISDGKMIYFFFKECVTVGLNSHIKSYQIILPKINDPENLVPITFDKYFKPLKIHVTSDGYHVISQRSLI